MARFIRTWQRDAGGGDSAAIQTIGTRMFPTFRILLATASLAILAVVVAARGLIPTPEVHTRIGEVPAVSRSLIQQAMVPRLPVQALINPVEERPVAPEVTGMASGQDIAPLPLDRVDSGNPDRTPLRPTKAAEEAEPSDPLGELIKATILQTPEPPPTIGAEPNPHSAETAGLHSPVPVPDVTTAPAQATGQPILASPDATSRPAQTQSADTAQADSKNVTPGKSADIAEAGENDTAAPQHSHNLRLSSPNSPPTLALGSEPTNRGNAITNSPGGTPAAVTAALNRNDTQYNRSPAKATKRRVGSARTAINRRKPAVYKRMVRRKALIKSRATSSRKSRQAARRVTRHKSRRAADTARRRRVVTVAPRRSAAGRSAPAVRYLAPVYPHQVAPSGYYPPAAGATAVH